MSTNNPRRLVSVTIPPDLMASLVERAEAAGQSLEAYCVAMLEASLREALEQEG